MINYDNEMIITLQIDLDGDENKKFFCRRI